MGNRRCENMVPKDTWPHWQRCPNKGVNWVMPPPDSAKTPMDEDNEWLCPDCTKLALKDGGVIVGHG